MKALVGAFNQEKALVGAFSVILQPVVEPMEHYTALDNTMLDRPGLRVCSSLIEVLITALVYNGGNVMSEVCYLPTTITNVHILL